MDETISRLVALLPPQAEDEQGSLDLVVHVPGTVRKPSFEGLRSAKFSKKERMLMVQIALPEDLLEGEPAEILRFLLDAMRQAIRLGQRRFEKAGIPYPQDEYLREVGALESTLLENR